MTHFNRESYVLPTKRRRNENARCGDIQLHKSAKTIIKIKQFKNLTFLHDVLDIFLL